MKRVKRIQNSINIAYTVLNKIIKHIYEVNKIIRKNMNMYKEYEVYTYKRYMIRIKYKVVSIYSTVNKKVSTNAELALRCTQVKVNKDAHVYLYSQSTRENRRSKTYVNESCVSEKYAKRVKVINTASVVNDIAGKIEDSVYVEECKCMRLYMVNECVRYVDPGKRKICGKGENGISGMEKRHLQYITKGNKRCVTSILCCGKFPKPILYIHCNQNLEKVKNISYGCIPVLTKMSTVGRGEDDVEMADPALSGEKGACRFSHKSCLIKSCKLLSFIHTLESPKNVMCRAVISLDCLSYIYVVYICPVIGKLNVHYRTPASVHILGKSVPSKRVYVLGELLFISWCSRYGE